MVSSTPFYQKLILWSALVATVVAALLVKDEAELSVEDVVQPIANPSGNQRVHEPTREMLSVDQLGRRQFGAKADDIFAITSWEPHAVSIDADEQAFQVKQKEIKWQTPPPSAPSLQFQYLGKVISQGRVRVFLAQEDENYAVSVGERINDEYRIDRIREDAVEFTYLPLGIRQILMIE